MSPGSDVPDPSDFVEPDETIYMGLDDDHVLAEHVGGPLDGVIRVVGLDEHRRPHSVILASEVVPEGKATEELHRYRLADRASADGNYIYEWVERVYPT